MLHPPVLIGGHEGAVAAFDVGAGFAFLDPLGVELEGRVNFYRGGDRLAEEATLDQIERDLRGGLVVRVLAVRVCAMRMWKFYLACLFTFGWARADQAADLARIHVEVIGGRERIEALVGLRASGYVVTGGKKVRFTMLAARPNRLRLETGAEGRSLVQASDGVAVPWKFDTGKWPPHYEPMGAAEGRVFTNDAEFDDPLVAGEARGFVCDYAGELESAGRKLVRILVTRKLTDTFSVLVDTETYFIVARIEHRNNASGRRVEIVTRYDDYRPVDGVLVPHKIAVVLDGKIMQQTVIENVEANPPVTAETFARPRAAQPIK